MDETYVKNAPQDSNDNDKKGGGHSNKTHTLIIAFKQKSDDIKAFVTVDTKYSTLYEIAMNTAEI